MNKRLVISVLAILVLLSFSAAPLSAQDSVRIRISADNIAFNKDELTVPAGAEVTLIFRNKESVPHNVAIYASSDAEEVIFKGETFSGPKRMKYEFTAPEKPGTYFFRYDVHPQAMTGDFVVTEQS
jgi:plastocyanin